MIFPTVSSEQDYSAIAEQRLRNSIKATCLQLGKRSLQRIHYGITGDKDSFGRNSFVQQILPGSLGRREMQRRNHTSKATVHFLGIGIGKIIRAQPCLNMADRNPQIEGS